MLNEFENYRMDNRTPEQFAQTMIDSAIIEADIIGMYVDYVQRRYNTLLNVVDNGCDNSGAFLTDNQVTTQADFLVNEIPVEVKHFKPYIKDCYLKAGPMSSYVKQGAKVLLVNGYASKYPKFTLIEPAQLQEIMNTIVPEPCFEFNGKMGYRFDRSRFKWFDLKEKEEGQI